MAYFDHNATTPVSQTARQTWIEASERFWQNPSSLYASAAAARAELENCRSCLADFFDCEEDEIVFTGGATEVANGLVRSLGEAIDGKLALSPLEHPAVAQAMERIVPHDRTVTLACDSSGQVDPTLIAQLFRQESIGAVFLLAASNETGALQPISAVQEICRSSGVLLVCDAVQWVGKMDHSALNSLDCFFASAHKFGGPKGVGFAKIPGLWRHRIKWQHGGPQENGLRAGTENLPAILAMTAAFQNAKEQAWSSVERDHFEAQITATIPSCRILSHSAPRLWNTSMVVMPEFDNRRWLARLDRLGFQVSTGSACSTGQDGPTQTFAAMGIAPEEAKRALRFSSGPATTMDDWQELADACLKVWNDLSQQKDFSNVPR